MSEWKGFDESQIERALSFADFVKTREDCHHINAYDSLKRLSNEVRILRAQLAAALLSKSAIGPEEGACPDCKKSRETKQCLSMAGYQLWHKGPGTRYAETGEFADAARSKDSPEGAKP